MPVSYERQVAKVGETSFVQFGDRTGRADFASVRETLEGRSGLESIRRRRSPYPGLVVL